MKSDISSNTGIKKIGIVGLGMLGEAVASHLTRSGFDVTAYNRTEEKTLRLREQGVRVVNTPREVAERSELVITIVTDAHAVRQVSFGRDGIAKGYHKDLIVADMSTISPADAVKIAEEFQEYNITKLDIPVMGGPNVAVTGELVMMVSGGGRGDSRKASFNRCSNVFDTIARKVFMLGYDNGVAHAVKLAMNLQITMLALSLAEGITLVKESGVKPEMFLEVLNSTYFKTGMSERKAYNMINGRYNTTFTLANLKKDIGIITDAADSLGIHLPMIGRAEQVYDNAIAEGFGHIDYTGIMEYIKKINR